MTVRSRLLPFVAVAVVFGLALLGILGFALWSTDRTVSRLGGAGGRLEALHDLDAATGHYGQEVVTQLLAGRERNEQLQVARNDMNRVLAELGRLTRLEVDTLSDRTMLQSELPELEKTRQMTDLFHDIDASTTAAVAALARDPVAARDLVNRGVLFRLANELQPLIDEGTADETGEIATEQAGLHADLIQAAIAMGVVALVGLAALGGLGWRLVRSGRQPGGAENGRQLPAPGEDATAGQARFMADLGHQLRTPLTVLRGESEVALRDGSVGGLRASMERIEDQAAEMAALLDEMIAAGRLGDAPPLVLSPVRLDEVVNRAAVEARVLTEPREITLAVDAPGFAVTVAADPRRLQQVVMIGLDNAVKHSPPGATITIETAIEGADAIVRISDAGPGLLPEDLPHVFDRFYRGRLEADLSNPGFGIGLSIARDIIERHHGRIALTNGMAGGAVFEIALPRAGGRS